MTALIMIIVLLAVIPLIREIYEVYRSYKQYMGSEYFSATKNPYKKVVDDRGLRGEYRVYKNLTKLEGKKRFLFNLYLPKDDGETTEVDVIMLHASGIYVFESKNYSGWIFGSEYQKNWTQTLPGRRKHAHYEHFMNPIAQNNVHLKWLDRALDDDSLVKHSYIVFGSDCKLKNVTLKDDKHNVLIVDDLLQEVQNTAKICGRVLSDEQIEAIYSQLSEFCNADEAVKKAHIEDVERKKNPPSAVSEPIHTAVIETEPDLPEKTPEPEAAPEIQPASPEITSEIAVEAPEKTANLCPLCGSELVLRRATRGANKGRVFWGCSAFPKCRYIKEIPIETENHGG